MYVMVTQMNTFHEHEHSLNLNLTIFTACEEIHKHVIPLRNISSNNIVGHEIIS